MKKAFLVLLLAWFSWQSMGVFAQSGVIKEMTGTVELKPAGTANFVPAVAGVQIKQDTVISTGFKSSALLEVGSALIAVRPLTRLTLTEIAAAQGTETLNVNLQTGRLRVDVKPPAGAKASLSVTSPIATASVRGTRFSFDTRNVIVHEGTVVLKGKRGYGVRLPAGSHSGVGADNTAAGAKDNASDELTPPSPTGYDEATTGTTGGPGAREPVSVGVEIEF
ncbi:MAG: FecR family protein [Treponema sp.]|jgi:hypothetical protein|nr:FecR family protein [Treponema sp.]